MPLLPQRLPRRNVFGADGSFLDELRKTDDRVFQKRPEFGRVDFLQRMHADFHLLPRPAQRLHFHPRLIAINRQVGQLVQRLELDSLLKLVALERAAIDTELELQQPGLAGDRMKEPAVRLSRRTNYDDASLAPVGFGKLPQFLNAIDDSLQNAAIPAARL